MARELSWSPEALEDIEAIASFIERDSPWYTQVVVSRLVEVVQSIPEFPAIGRIVPEIGSDDIRERFVYAYRVIYRVEPARIVIAAVVHGRRLLEPRIPGIEG